MLTKPMKQNVIELCKDRRGNFAMIAAIVAPLLLAAGGLSLDIANQAALKTRFQAASDSVSLAVATRIANGDLTIANAQNFGARLLKAQMANDSSRFSNLKVTPKVRITENKNGGSSIWDVEVGGTATQDTTPFSSFLNKETISVNVSSVAQSGTDDQQGALSMSIVVDISLSMDWKLDKTTSEGLASNLKIPISEARRITNTMNRIASKFNLSAKDMTYIIENYIHSDCDAMANNSSSRRAFLSAIGKHSIQSAGTALNICRGIAAATKTELSHQEAIEHANFLVSTVYPQKKIDALKDALKGLFKQFDASDPSKTYVRTGLSAYSFGVIGDTDMEWGSDSAAYYASRMRPRTYTSSTNSVKWAYNQLKSSNSTEATKHADKNGQYPDRFILFMTDGDNTYRSDDTATKSYCDKAKADGIKVYSVAFAAPDRGKKLLKNCASSDEYYFTPNTAADLIAAFKDIGSKTSASVTRLTH